MLSSKSDQSRGRRCSARAGQDRGKNTSPDSHASCNYCVRRRTARCRAARILAEHTAAPHGKLGPCGQALRMPSERPPDAVDTGTRISPAVAALRPRNGAAAPSLAEDQLHGDGEAAVAPPRGSRRSTNARQRRRPVRAAPPPAGDVHGSARRAGRGPGAASVGVGDLEPIDVEHRLGETGGRARGRRDRACRTRRERGSARRRPRTRARTSCSESGPSVANSSSAAVGRARARPRRTARSGRHHGSTRFASTRSDARRAQRQRARRRRRARRTGLARRRGRARSIAAARVDGQRRARPDSARRARARRARSRSRGRRRPSRLEAHEVEPLEQPRARLVVDEASGIEAARAVERAPRGSRLGQRVVEAKA